MNTQKTDSDGQTKRRSRWKSSWAALNAIAKAFKNPESKFRQADKTTNILLICFIAITIFWFLVPGNLLLIFICDLLFGLVLIFYVAQRLGIFTTLSNRQIILLTELMLSMLLIGLFWDINIEALADVAKGLMTIH